MQENSSNRNESNRFVSSEIMGGLGNQLFQIFNTIAYSLRHKVPFYFPDESIKHGERKKTYWHTHLLQALEAFVKASTPSLTYNEKQFHYQAIPSPPPPPLKLFGYFQSYKYFQDHQEDIYKLIRLTQSQSIIKEKTQQPPYNYNYANNNKSNLIAIHFRVGDYKNLPNHHPLMTLEYYTAALKQLLEEATQDSNSPTMHNILYFCEETDQDYVQKQMILPLKANPLFTNKIGSYQCINHKLEDWEQLLVMSLCQKHIIANSTFSWWGAYLSEEKPSKSKTGQSPQVYYPTTWFGPAMGNKNMSDLFPPHWNKINV
jgi:Glycosyl transferase family 11